MTTPEIDVCANRPTARWLDSKFVVRPIQAGDPLPFNEIDDGRTYAPLVNGLERFFTETASAIDWRYGAQEFRDMVNDALFLNTLLDIALLQSDPPWDEKILERFNTPELEEMHLSFLGYGFGGSFRSAISQPDNYSAVATLHKRLFGDLPDMMDIDRKLPLGGQFGQFMEDRLMPNLLRLLKGGTFGQIRIKSDEKDVVFKGVMVRKSGKPETVVAVRFVRYVHLTALEVRLSDVREKADPRFPDITIHVTNYERDLRVGPQMPRSMNTLVPLYSYSKAEEGYSTLYDSSTVHSQQWMVLSNGQFNEMRANFEHPEVIDEPIYRSIEEALHAGLRAIAEKTQHLGEYCDPNTSVPIGKLLSGNWWVRYRKELLMLLKDKKTEQDVFNRENKFLNSEILRLFMRLNDFDSELFLRMAIPMGIMDALEPGLRRLIYGYGYMVYGPSFSFSKPECVDTAITMFCLQFPSWHARDSRDFYDIKRPELLGSQRLLRLLEVYRKQRKIPIEGPLANLRTWLYSAQPYKI